MFKRQSTFNFVVIGTIIVCALALVFAFAIFAFRAQDQPLNLIEVPGDYETIQEAIDAAQPGYIIRVAPGTYNGSITLNKAVVLTAGRFDAINPVNNNTTIDGMGGAAVITIPSGLTQMPTIRGFVIRNGSHGIDAQSGFIAEANYLHTATILVNYQAGGGGVNRGNVYFSAADDAIHMDNILSPLLIENNRIMYAGEDGIEINLQNDPIPPAPIQVDIWNNMIIGSREDGIQFVDYEANPQDTNRRFMIAGNLIANNRKAGIGLMPNANTKEDFSGADIVEAIRVFNNTFYGNDHAISGGDNLVSFNGIIVNSITRGAWRVQGPPGANSVVAYTLLHRNGTNAEETTLGAGIITGEDPLFQAAPNPGPDGTWETVDDDFSGLVLRAESPAIDRGVTQFIAANGEPIPPSPLTGFAGSAPDLGWREFGSPAVITPTASPIPSATLPATATPLTPLPSPTMTATVLSPTPVAGTATVPAAVTSTPVTPLATSTSAPTATPATPTPTTTAQVTITNVIPNFGQANTTINVTLTGSGFANGAVVVFDGGQGIASEVTNVQVVNPSTIVMTVNVKADAAFGSQLWDLRVTNPNATFAVLMDAFTVNP